MEITIIDYDSNFYEQLYNLLKDIYASTISKQELELHYLGENKKIYLAQKNNIIVGCSFLEIRTDYIRPYKYGFVTYVAVDEKHRKQGIGKKLLNHIFLQAKELGCTTVELTSANSRESAHIFYESIGFTKKKTTVFIKDPL